MKKFTLFFALLFTGLTFAQQTEIEIIAEDDGVNYAGQTVHISGSEMELNRVFYVHNLGSASEFYFGREVIYKESASFMVQLCDDHICYNTDFSGDVLWISPKEIIQPGESMLFKPQMTPLGGLGMAEVRYYVLDSNKDKIDSLTVIFEATLSLQKEDLIQFTMYPNPAQKKVTIEGMNFQNDAVVSFHDALGKEVKKQKIKGVTSTLDISDLKRGVYFVSISTSANAKSALQRLIVQ